MKSVNRRADEGVRWNDSFDGFMHGLRAVHAYLGKGEKKEGDVMLVLVVGCAERLIPELTRLAELVSPFVVVVHACMAQLTFLDRHRLTFASSLFQRPHVRRSDHRWACLLIHTSSTYHLLPRTVRLEGKISLQSTHSISTDIIKHLISKSAHSTRPSTPLHAFYNRPLRRLLSIYS